MSESGKAVWFLGDLEDPWVVAIGESLAGLPGLQVRGAGRELPAPPGGSEEVPGLLIVHRSRLTTHDLARLETWKSLGGERGRANQPRILLCYGPNVRYAELERCARLANLLIPEATASETLHRQARRLAALEADLLTRPPGQGRRVDVVSSNRALRDAIAEGLAELDFSSRAVADSGRFEALLPESDDMAEAAVWDVPVLEPGWPEVMQRRARLAPVVALLGLADRGLVAEARAAGASACLDLPLDLEDLGYVIDRVLAAAAVVGGPGARRAEGGHGSPPPPASRSRWPRQDSAPTMTSKKTTT
ncbi:hypothetical protein OJF2_20250 [Aquisphaera giovannonii]|uniref:Response regulatory domain-containing protein n=1 Tax=Aquisphaera giovannonii TaxID=406548 RepID=A0A5B9VYV1_9BACT|nr:hypothetical protein [Aquisphaera giovannonii]QEH33523.1 hypothetical protein OJF2_20250 [Aquisphaera giovannonii]